MGVSISDMLFGAVERQLSRVAGINIVERADGKESDENAEVRLTGNRGEAVLFMKFRRSGRLNKREGGYAWQVSLSAEEQARIENRLAGGIDCCLAVVCVKKSLDEYKDVNVVFMPPAHVKKLREAAGGAMPGQFTVVAIEGKNFRIRTQGAAELKVAQNGLVKWAKSIS